MNRDQAARAFADYCLGIGPSPDPADWIARQLFLNPGYPLPPATFTADVLQDARRRLNTLEQSFNWHLDHPTMWNAVPAASISPEQEPSLRARFRASLGLSSQTNLARFPAVIDLDLGHYLTPPDSHLKRELRQFLTSAVAAALPLVSAEQYPILAEILPASLRHNPISIRFPRRAPNATSDEDPDVDSGLFLP